MGFIPIVDFCCRRRYIGVIYVINSPHSIIQETKSMKQTRTARIVVCMATLFVLLVPGALPSRADPPRLSLPLACKPRENCFIQNYVDVDPTPLVHDYTCHGASYDGHKGVDFRISSIADMKKGVPVLAAAPGRVKAVRDGMVDRLIRSEEDRIAVRNRECGNGLLVVHDDGWETQYCHMKKGSLRVQPGDIIQRGQILGMVGLSGQTAFPHIHLAIRHMGNVIDPFTGTTPGKKPCGQAGAPLWQPSVLKAFPYADGQPFVYGFTDHAVNQSTLVQLGKPTEPFSRRAQALVFYGMALNLEKGDRLRIVLTGPDGELARQLTKPFNRNKASYLSFAGRKRTTPYWPPGRYRGSFSLLRGNRVIWTKQQNLTLADN